MLWWPSLSPHILGQFQALEAIISMEKYISNQVRESACSRPNFLHSFSSHHLLQSGGSDESYQSAETEANNSIIRNPSQIFHYPLINRGGSQTSSEEIESLKAKIAAHPHYANLVEAYINCHKVQITLNFTVSIKFFLGLHTHTLIRYR